MFQTEVTVIDAVVVVTLMESSMLSAALISADNALHSTFPQDPMKEYQCQGIGIEIPIRILTTVSSSLIQIETLQIELNSFDEKNTN